MNRLAKKCMIASAGMHVLLIVALFVGAAFTPKKADTSVPIITVFDAKITDGPTSGGGNPTVTQPPPPAEPPPPAPPQVAQKDPDPQPEPPQKEPDPKPPEPAPPVKQPDPPKIVETVKPKESDFVVTKPKTPPKPTVALKPVDRSPTKPTTAKPAAAKPSIDFSKKVVRPRTATTTASSSTSTSTSSSNKKLASELSKNINNFASSIRNSSSSSTSVEMPGPGGEAFVKYSDLVGSIYQRAYDRALTTAGEIADRDDSVDAAVVIGRDGRIISSRITRSSGSPALNKLVKGVLDRIDSIPGFPEAARDSQRTFNITFDFKSRRLTG